MNKKRVLSLVFTALSLSLIGCGDKKEEITANLKDVMAQYQKARNYTYEVDDEIFEVKTTLRYTENAYYYQPSASKHGGEAYGYAENELGIFDYVIKDDHSVEIGEYVTGTGGDYVKDMWGMKILSFYDIDLNALPETPEEGTHKYKIEDANNKLLISGLAGLGDTILQSYIDVYIELTSNTTFRTIVYTGGLTGGYIGYAYGTIKDVGTTTIPEIENAMKEGLAPELIDNTLVNALKKLKTAKNYRVTISGEVNYIDLFTIRNSYSKNLDDDTKSVGYAGSPDGVYKYQIVDGNVIADEVIDNGSGGSFSNIWIGIPGVYTLSSIGLNNVTHVKNDDGTYTINNILLINTFEQASHLKETSKEEDNASLVLKIEEEKITYTLNLKDNKTLVGVVDSFGNVSIPEIEQYIENGGGPAVYGSIDQTARDVLFELSKLKNYTLTIDSNINSGSIKPFTLTKKFTSSKYYQSHSVDSAKTYGYLEEASGVYEFNYNENGELVKGRQIGNEGDFLWSTNVFKGLNILSSSDITGKKINSNTYEITDSTHKNYIYEIAGFSIYDLMFSTKDISFVINDIETKDVDFIINCGDLGKVTISVSDINATEIK